MIDPVSVPADDLAAVEQCRAWYEKLRGELAGAIVGRGDVIEQLVIAMLARGHVFVESTAGLSKTLLMSSLAAAARLSFQRTELTADLLPGELIGSDVPREDPETGRQRYQFLPGPLFANMILVNDINRAPPKTQAAVLEAMQQRQLVSGGQVRQLPDPFFVLAAQSPREQDGTSPLSEGQLDRFLLYIKLRYPKGSEEWEIVSRATGGKMGKITPLAGGEDIVRLQQLVLRMPLSDQVLGYAWALVRATRPHTPEAPEFVDKWMAYGAGPRGVLALVLCAKAWAVLHGRCHATVGDVQWVVKPVLRHRIAGSFAATANNLGSDSLIDMLLEAVPVDTVKP